ncbi:hypothetical protein GHT06_016054 [Daphnia sinensis]|uniref:Methyltransferase domain-containing protein n=1 Tax=Daphnia sinensis TaxID=1820382 RepID=A0AAD5LCA5_9CRUS|nr:hypothetical protein GHT06_016054 [Daphnia sinensis]
MSLFDCVTWKRMNAHKHLLLFTIIVLITVPYIHILLKTRNEESKEETCCSYSNWDELLDSKSLTGEELMEYFTWTNRSSCQLAHDFGGKMMSNPSGIDGQKCVCIDPRIAPLSGQCLVYSFGINNEWSFDEQMESYGCQVFAFDPSMNQPPHNHSSAIHFYDWGLGDRDEKLPNNWQIHSLSSIYNNLTAWHGSVIIDYLKIDIEGAEWRALPEIMNSGLLSRIRQLGVEIHLNSVASLEQHREWAKVLRSLEQMGMIRFDSKRNPWYTGDFGKFRLSGSFGHEIAWYNSKLLRDLH